MRTATTRRPGELPSVAPVRDHYLTTSDGVRLSVREYGSPDAEHTVVLLHGLCLNKESWHLQVDDLIRRWGSSIRVITYDHRGHGASAQAAMHTYRIARLADDLADLLVALRVSGRLTLVGHSMGGMAALAYLGRPWTARPVDNLILVASAAGKLPERGVGRLLASPAADILYDLVRRAPRIGVDAAARIITGPLREVLTRHGGTTSREALATVASFTATPLAAKVGFLRALKEHDQYRTLVGITAATTVISGGMDLLTPPAHAFDLAAGIPGARHLHHPAAGHMLLHEVAPAVSVAISAAVAAGRRTPAVA